MSIDEQIDGCQAVGTYLLETFADVCELYGIGFFLNAGTLIGAFRNGGWLAWDDDVDVLMFRTEYERFKTLAAADLPSGVSLVDPVDDKSCATVVPRLSYEDSGLKWIERLGIQPPERQRLLLDIFVLDHAPDSAPVRTIWNRLAALLIDIQVLRATTSQRVLQSTEPTTVKTAALAAMAVSHALPIRAWKRLYVRVVGAYAKRQTQFVVANGHSRHQRAKLYRRAWFPDNPQTLEFEGRRYPVPSAEAFLQVLFGPDFRTPPPPDQRNPHPFVDFWAVLGGRRWGAVPDGRSAPLPARGPGAAEV